MPGRLAHASVRVCARTMHRAADAADAARGSANEIVTGGSWGERGESEVPTATGEEREREREGGCYGRRT